MHLDKEMRLWDGLNKVWYITACRCVLFVVWSPHGHNSGIYS